MLGRLRRAGRLHVPLCAVITDLAGAPLLGDARAPTSTSSRIPSRSRRCARSPATTPTVHCVHGFTAPEFLVPREAVDARRALKLDPGAKIVLVSGGGWGVGDVEGAVREVLEREGRRPGRLPLRAQRGAPRASSSATSPATRACASSRFTDEMPDWLAAADALVHSTGGLTVLEALMRGCPAISYGWGRGHVRAQQPRVHALRARPGRGDAGRAPRAPSRPRSSRDAPPIDFSELPSAASFVLAEAERGSTRCMRADAERGRARARRARGLVRARRGARRAAGRGAGSGSRCGCPAARARAHLRRRAASRGDAGRARRSSSGPACARPSTSSASRSSAGPRSPPRSPRPGTRSAIHGYRHTLLLRRTPGRAARRPRPRRRRDRRGDRAARASPTGRRTASSASPGLRLARERWAPLLWSHWGRDWEATGDAGRRSPRSRRAALGPGRRRAAARQRRLQRRRARGVRRWRRCRRCSRRRSRPASRSSRRASRRSGGRPRRSSSARRQPSSAAARALEAWPNFRSAGRSGTCSTGTSATSSRTVSAIWRTLTSSSPTRL